MKKLLLLTLLPVFGLLLSNNCSALQYDYKGLAIGSIYHPSLIYDNDLSLYRYDWSQTSLSSSPNYSGSSPFFNSLSIIFPNDYDFASTSVYDSSGYYLSNNDNFSFTRSGDICNISKGNSSTYIILSNVIRHISSGSYSKELSFSTRGYPVDKWTAINDCYKRSAEDLGLSYRYTDVSGLSNHFTKIDFYNSSRNDINFPQLTGLSNSSGVGYKIGTTDGLRLSDSFVNHNGVTYDGSFSFSRILKNNNALGFSSMKIPLFSWDGYFLDYNNLYQGRELEWKFIFHFKGGVTVNSGSSIKLLLSNARDLYSNNNSSPEYGCNSEIITSELDGEAYSTLEVSCPLTLSSSYSGFYPYLHFSSSDGDDISFFSTWTANDWYFSSALFITDSDYTPAGSFNADLHGNMWSLSNGTDYDVGADPDWLTSLKNLFVFGIPVSSTPLGLILGGFSNQSSCANIPTIAGMINSNDTQVCPFFPSSVRSITTPVLGLFSVCLVFGAFMSWLGGSSGNFIEDSSSHTWGGFKIAKGGKK